MKLQNSRRTSIDNLAFAHWLGSCLSELCFQLIYIDESLLWVCLSVFEFISEGKSNWKILWNGRNFLFFSFILSIWIVFFRGANNKREIYSPSRGKLMGWNTRESVCALKARVSSSSTAGGRRKVFLFATKTWNNENDDMFSSDQVYRIYLYSEERGMSFNISRWFLEGWAEVT